MHFRFGQDEEFDGQAHADNCEPRRGADQVIRLRVVFAAEVQKLLQISLTKIFAAGGFWRRLVEVRLLEERSAKRRDVAALHREPAAFVEALSVAAKMRNERVNQHVRGSGVECD